MKSEIPEKWRKARKEEAINADYANFFGETMLPVGAEVIKKQYIRDLPILRTPDGTIVCIPKLEEQGLIVNVGQTGKGKTISAGYLLGNIFYLWNDYIAILNDSQNETFDWSEEQDVLEFVMKLRILGQTPIPLPMVYLLPHSDKYEISPELLKEKSFVTISVPFQEVMERLEKYLPDLGGSEKYLLTLKDKLIAAEDKEEMFEIIGSLSDATKGMKEVKAKLVACFQNLLDEGILNLSSFASPSSLRIGDADLNPFVAIMKSECVPSFITSDLYNQRYGDAIFSYYISELFEASKSGAMKGKRVWLYFDELTNVVHSNPQHSKPETERALSNIASRGRNNGISLIYATQRYAEIPKSIRSQTKFALIFRHKSMDEAKEICNDFGISKNGKGEIMKLRKFEAIAATTEYFVCYKGNKKWPSSETFKGLVFPSMHRNKFLQKQV